MPEVSGTQLLKSASDAEPESESYKLADSSNRYIEVTLDPIGRKELFDDLSRMPDEFIETMVVGSEDVEEPLDSVEDPEDVDLDVDDSELLSSLDGSVLDVFETLFAKSASHPDLTSLDMETLSESLDLGALFDVGGRVISMSLENSGNIKHFQEPASDKSS